MDASLAARRGRVVTAAVRTAFAWSARDRDVRAFREIARMTGVVMEALGPGQGPVTPGELVAALQRPLGHILPAPAEAGAASADGTADAVLLTEDGRPTDVVFELGCEYVQDVMGSLDPATEWLPSWTWMQAEQVEREVFGRLIDGGSDDDYHAARRFLVEFPRRRGAGPGRCGQPAKGASGGVVRAGGRRADIRGPAWASLVVAMSGMPLANAR